MWAVMAAGYLGGLGPSWHYRDWPAVLGRRSTSRCALHHGTRQCPVSARQVVGSIPLEGSEAIQDCVAGPEHACDMTQECWSRPYP